MVELIQPTRAEWPNVFRHSTFRGYAAVKDALPPPRLLEQYLLGVSASPLGYRYGVPLLILHEATSTIVGNIGGKGLVQGEEEVELGYHTSSDYRNRGIMTAAIGRMQDMADDDGLGLLAHIEPGNPASRRVLEKCKFTFDSLVRLPDSLDLERWSWSPD